MSLSLIPFEVVDLSSFASSGPVFLVPDQELVWSPDAAGATDDLVRSGIDHRWCLTATDCPIGTRALSIDILTVEPALAGERVGRIMRFLEDLDGIDAAIRETVRAGFDDVPSLADSLVPDLLTSLDASYLDALFAPRSDPGRISPEEFLRGLELCRVGYDAGDGGGREEAEGFSVDYRLLVSTLTEEDAERIDDLLRFGDRYDVTNQVLCAKLSPNRRVLDLVIES